ncbi:hypothetical protein HPULCUR_011334 [Helicostylum pulchrum]|uniref:Uncharacterized protein n=1 Tax=Helicostylum pulchrum TaxID=562976 RepID=A0ABP9YGU6_9FUNG
MKLIRGSCGRAADLEEVNKTVKDDLDDDDLQPPIITRKRKGMYYYNKLSIHKKSNVKTKVKANTQLTQSRDKKCKGKGKGKGKEKALDTVCIRNEVGSTNTSSSSTAHTNVITLADYDFHSSDYFDESTVKSVDLGESSKSIPIKKGSKNVVVKSTSTATDKADLNIKKAADSGASSTNTKEEPAISKQVIAVKATISNIWKPEYLQPLHEFVDIVNKVVSHTFTFTKYIFVKELAVNIGFDLNSFVNKNFFVEVFLSLVHKQVRNGSDSGKTKSKDSTKLYRQLIAKHKDSYCKDTSYIPPKLVHSQQIALYECTKIRIAYQNNIKAHFGTRLRTMLNKLFGKDEKLNNIRERTKAEGFTEKDIK